MHRRRSAVIRHLLLLAYLLTANMVYAETPQPLRINTGFKKPVSDIYRLVIEDAFQRIGLPVDFREVSAERSLSLANEGIDDGDCCRIAEIGKYYPNLVGVPVKVINIDFAAFTRNPDVTISSWDDLAPYEVGVVRGWKILEQGLEQHPTQQTYVLSSPASMFRMLEKDRIQVATIGRLVGYQTLADLGMQGVRIQEPPLVSRELFLQLNQRHAALVPALTRALQAMRDDGTLDRYYQEIVDPLLLQLQQTTSAPELDH